MRKCASFCWNSSAPGTVERVTALPLLIRTIRIDQREEAIVNEAVAVE